jgi:glycerol uptake facilitator-like aquaporin
MTDASLEPPREAFDAGRRVLAEALGAAWLLATVVGSGIMAERLSLGNNGVALLANSLATGGSLFVLITIFGPLSGAHFNPAVSLAFAIRRELGWRMTGAYVAAQLVGAVLGVYAAHAMFAEPIWQVSARLRDGPAQAFSEAIATFGLIVTILGTLRFRPAATPATVSLYIVAAYWFTASTSFANPAVTFARALTNTFAGIAPSSAPLFIAGELIGTLIGVAVGGSLFVTSSLALREHPLQS